MKIKYLGTGAAEAFPAMFCHCDVCVKARKLGGRNIRGRSGCVINDTILIDFPPDIYFLSLKHNIDLGNIKDIFITHSHADHFTPAELLMRMPGCYAYPDNVEPLKLYGNEETKNVLIEATRREFDFDETNFIKFEILEYFKPIKSVGETFFTHLPALHKMDEKSGIFLVEEKEEKFLYAHDTGMIPIETINFLEGKKLTYVSFDCTNCKNYDNGHHMGLPNVLETIDIFREKNIIDDNTKIIINHFSHNGGSVYDEMVDAVKPYGIITAYDGMDIGNI